MTSDATVKRIGNSRGSGSDLREEILAAAERLLAMSGPRDTVTLRAIAREAGIAAPSIYPHFRDRDAILDAVVDRTFVGLADTCHSAAAGAPRGVERVTAISLAYLGFARRNPGQYRILFERSPGNIASPPHRYPEGIDAFGVLTSALEDVAAQGSRGDLDPTTSAQSLFVALHGIATLPPTLPGFPWLAEPVLVGNVIEKIVGVVSGEEFG